MSAAETGVLHTREQGKRVHVLANLGGLVAIAGMERVEPDLLLGALLEVADRLPKMKAERLEAMRQRGASALDERGTSKRAWSARQSALDLHNVHLTSDQIRGLLRRLGERVPGERTALPQALSDALQEL
ncbi:MAG: conjugal transfer protein TraD [Acidimicrobiia bacterium]|nr:conjugal transfer protein TraD [Acidimicrobiia bacterium]